MSDPWPMSLAPHMTWARPLRSQADVDAFVAAKRVADRARDKLRDIVEHGRLAQNATLAARPANAARVDLMRVWGIGARVAEHLYEREGVASVEQLRARLFGENAPADAWKSLGCGLTYNVMITARAPIFEELLERMPRDAPPPSACARSCAGPPGRLIRSSPRGTSSSTPARCASRRPACPRR